MLLLSSWGCSPADSSQPSSNIKNSGNLTNEEYVLSGSVEMGYCKKVCIKDALAFCLDSLYGLHIINLKNPNEPFIESSVRAPQPNDLFLADGTIYISDYIEGIIAVDVTDFKSPAIKGRIKEPNQTFSIFCKENNLFVTTQYTYYEKKYSNFLIYDISDKNNPEKISFLDNLPWINDVYVDKNHAYLAFDDADGDASGLIIIDISDILRPSICSRLVTDGFAINLTVREDTVFLADDMLGIKIIDAENKQEPVLISSLKLENHTSDIAIDGDFAYAADGYNGVKKINIKSTGKPEIIGSINTLGFSRGLAIDNKYIYIADGKYLTVADKF